MDTISFLLFLGSELSIVSDDAFYLANLPKRIAILGSGYIAIEFAGIFASLGSEVDLVYRKPLPLYGFDIDLRKAQEEALKVLGVRLYPESHPAKIEEGANGTRILHLSNGTVINTDMVFSAVGRRPNTKGLGLEKAGVQVNEEGAIKVNVSSFILFVFRFFVFFVLALLR